MYKLPRLTAALTSIAICGAAVSATTSTTFQVTATVAGACSVSATTLNFGSLTSSPNGLTAVDAQSTLTVNCSANTPWSAGLSPGAGQSFNPRTMSGPNQQGLSYNIYRSAAERTQGSAPWDDANNVRTGAGSGAPQTVDVFGRVFPTQTAVPAGSYTDTITVTLTF